MLKRGAWRLMDESNHLTDYYSLKCKSIIVDNDTGERFVCSPQFEVFEMDKYPPLYEDTHNVKFIPITGRAPCMEESIRSGSDTILNDIWVNTLFK